MSEPARDYQSEYDSALKTECESYIDHMTIDEMRGEMRALIKMLDAERKFSSGLQKRMCEMTGLAFKAALK